MSTKEQFTLTGIPLKEVEAMVKAHHDHAIKHPHYSVEEYHVKCVWFKIDQITELYKKLIKEGADGLRIYLGRYPNDTGWFQDPKPCPDTASVILISTKKIDNQVGTDYFTDDKGAHPATPENRGEQCEPLCDGTLLGNKY